MTKSGREIVEVSGAFDLTGAAWSAIRVTVTRRAVTLNDHLGELTVR